jgi:integrase
VIYRAEARLHNAPVTIPSAAAGRGPMHGSRAGFTDLASGGMPLLMIRGLLGHQSSRMTERYAHLAAEQSEAFMHLLSAASPTLGPATSDASPSGPQVGPRPSHQPN